MALRKQIQLGLIHLAVAMTLVPINSTLNRVMIKELALSALLVGILASLPYLFSPIQVAIGSFADRHPLWGRRRTPYITLGLLLCVIGVFFSPYAAFALHTNLWVGIPLSVLTFGAWGMGYNFATVSYFSLATEISGKKNRSRTIAIMFFLMIVGIILTAALLGRLLVSFTDEALIRAFAIVAGLAFILGAIGLTGLEEPFDAEETKPAEVYSWHQLTRMITGNRQVTLFFWYLILLLVAILGQDILLEPYAAEAFGLPVNATTRITSLWGSSFLLSMLITSALEKRLEKRTIAYLSAWGAIAAFIAIVISGSSLGLPLFYGGVILLGMATGFSTVSNLSLMLDMTAPGKVGLFIGAWGMASAFARLTGNILSGGLRDLITNVLHNPITGYQLVFLLETMTLFTSLFLLRQIDVRAFQQQEGVEQPSLVDRAALAGDVS